MNNLHNDIKSEIELFADVNQVFILMLLGWVTGIITPVLTYYKKGLFYNTYKEDELTEVYFSS